MRYRSNNAFGCPITHPRSLRRRRPRRALPLPVGRGVLRARARAQGGHPVDALRRPRPAAQRHPRRRPGALLRAQEDVPLGARRRARHATTRCRSARRRWSATGSQVSVIAYGLMAQYALEAAELLEPEGISAEVVDVRTLRPLDGDDDPRLRAQDRQVRGRLRGQPLRRLRRGDRGDHRRGGLRLPRRPGHPRHRPGRPRRSLQPRLEEWFMPNPDRIATAVRRLAAY